MNLEIKKSSRHAKIGGDFGELLVLYWLSKHNFECARVDHTGIDLIANNPYTDEVMGISVKCRTRHKRNASKPIGVDEVGGASLAKAEAACKAFHCSPYIAIVADCPGFIRVFVTSIKHLRELCPSKTRISWKMGSKHLDRYKDDKQVMAFHFSVNQGWWWKPKDLVSN